MSTQFYLSMLSGLLFAVVLWLAIIAARLSNINETLRSLRK